jgi:hypothetical protein
VPLIVPAAEVSWCWFPRRLSTAAARRSVQPASSGRAWSPWSARPGRQLRRRSPVRVHHVVSTQRFRRPGPASSRPVSGRLVSSASGVHPPVSSASGVQCVQCPARPVSTVRRPAGCCPPPSVRTRPSRPPSGGGGGDQLEAAGNRHHKNGSSPGGLPRLGAARCTAEQARTRAMLPRSRWSGGRWRTRARWAAGAAALDRLINQAGQAGVRSAVANGRAVGSGAGCSASLPQRPCGCRRGLGGRPRWVVVMGPAARVGGPGRAGGRAGGDGRAAPARPRLAAGAPGSLPTAL